MDFSILTWSDPAPLSQIYPWSNLQVTEFLCAEDVEYIFSSIMEKGDESLAKGDFYDSLWKYEHAINIVDTHPLLATDMARALIRAALACLHLGEDDSEELNEHGESSCWFYYGYQYANTSLSHNPDPAMASNAYLRRASCLQRLLQAETSSEAVNRLIQSLNVDSSQILNDYVKSFELDPENIEAICLAIFEATKIGQISVLPSLTEEHASLQTGTKIIKRLMSSPDTSSVHLHCLLNEMTPEHSHIQHFNASSVEVSSILDKKIFETELYEQLVKNGLLITPLCLEKASEDLPQSCVQLFNFLLSECKENDFLKAQKLCEATNKTTFLEAITRKINEIIEDHRKSGDICLQSGTYHEALTKYKAAINICERHNKTEENFTLKISCAQTRHSMGDYSEAFEYCTQAIQLDPQNPLGYYHRAEILLASLELFLSDDIGTYENVVKDYLKCHELKADVDVFCKAVVVSVNNDCSEVIPRIGIESTNKEFYMQVLPNIVEKHQLTEPILEFLLLDLPLDPRLIHHDASGLKFDSVCRITSQSDLLTKLIKCGMKVDESHIIKAYHVLEDYSEEDTELLEYVIQHCKKSQSFQKCLDEVCSEAMQSNEQNIVRVFIKNGARPHPRSYIRFADKSLHEMIESETFMNNVNSSFMFPWDIIRSQVHIEELLKEAERFTRLNLIGAAIQCYSKALQLSEKLNSNRHTFTIHKNLAQLYIKKAQYEIAHIHSVYMITLSPTDSKGFIYSGEALKKGMASERFKLSGPILDNYYVVSAYRTAYSFDFKMSNLAEALLMASKNGDMINAVSEECQELNKHKCLQLLQELIKKDCSPEVFKFLWGLWGDRKGINYSALSMKDLLCMKEVPSDTMISQLILLGACVDHRVLVCAIENLSNDRIDTLKLIESKCGNIDSNAMCQAALRANNAHFLAYYLNKGAKWPNHHVEILQQLVKNDSFSGFELILKLLTDSMVKEVDITQFISSKLGQHYKYIVLLLDAGVNPNGKMSSIKAVQELKINHRVKVNIICLLIQRGANCNDLCDLTTTPLHVATKMAIESNHTDIILAVVSSPFFTRYQIFNEKGETPIHLTINSNVNKQTCLKVLIILLELDFIDPTVANTSGKMAVNLIKSNHDPRTLLIQKYLEHWKKRKIDPLYDGIQFVSPSFSAQDEVSVPESEGASVANVMAQRTLTSIEVLPYKGYSNDKKLAFHLDRISKAGKEYVKDNVDSTKSTLLTISQDIIRIPSKEWLDDSEIVQIDSSGPVFVQGQRGTGKTTCCFGRLWNEFEKRAMEGPSSAQVPVQLHTEKILHQIFITKSESHCENFRKTFLNKASSCNFYGHVSHDKQSFPDCFNDFKESSLPIFLTSIQFFMLLDNSLDDNMNFFERDDAGKIRANLASLRYDHSDQDVLWELLETTSDNEILEVLHGKSPALKKYVEVTFEYFKHIIWPKISTEHDVKAGVNPSLAWLEIQQIIKGSTQAMKKGFPLTFEEYKEIDSSMAPHFSARREVVYKLYQRYQQFLLNSNKRNRLFDECDLALNIFQRLRNKTEAVPGCIRKIYIDDAQSFTTASLALIISCSTCPNSVFIAGSEMPGTGHQQQNVQEYFHLMSQIIPIKAPIKMFELDNSYRMCSGIQNLADNTADLINHLFMQSGDYMPCHREPSASIVPAFIESCKETGLLKALSVNKRGCFSVELGPSQVILVRSESTKETMPQFLKNAVILTIDQVKDMEFDDVVLYNFFTDSKVTKETWTKLIEFMGKSNVKDKSDDIMFACQELRAIRFAITSARKKLWLFDSDHDKRLPMLKYWQQKGLLELLTVDNISEKKGENIFLSLSTPLQWKFQGDIFRNNSQWEQAIFCYTRAGPDCLYLLKETHGFNFIQEYLHSGKQDHLQEAALCFFESDSLNHSVKCIRSAASCLTDLKCSAFSKVVHMLEAMDDFDKAAQVCLKNKDMENCTRILEKCGEYNCVMRALTSNITNKKKNVLMRTALEKARQYESKGVSTDVMYSCAELSYSCAKFYFNISDYDTLLDILKYMPNAALKHALMKRAHKFEAAFNSYAADEDYSCAYKLALSQGWFNKAIRLATTAGDHSQVDQIILLEARTCCASKSKDPSRIKKVTAKLEELIQKGSGISKAEARLLLGKLHSNPTHFKLAMEEFRIEDNKAGMLESFELMQSPCNQEVLHICKVAQNLCEVLRGASDFNIDLQQTMQFYGLQFVGNSYLTSKYGHCFVSLDDILEYQNRSDPVDLDGRFRIQPGVKELFAKRFESLSSMWMTKFDIKTTLLSKCKAFKLHLDLWKNRQLSCQYPQDAVPEQSMLQYLQDCLTVLDLRVMNVQSMLVHLDVIFSPGVSICLPCLSYKHIHAIRQSLGCLILFEKEIEKELAHLTEIIPDNLKYTGKISIDSWLKVWRLSSLSYPNMQLMRVKLREFESRINEEKSDFQPPGFIYWQSEKRFIHIFHFWLQSCVKVRDNGKAMLGAKLAIVHFLGSIAKSSQTTISIINITNILSIHCTSLLAMIVQASCAIKPLEFFIPAIFKSVQDLFNSMNCYCNNEQEHDLFSACAREVHARSSSLELIMECKNILNIALSYLAGGCEEAPKFCVLRYALRKYGHTDQALQCLILTLTIFGNLAIIQGDVSKYSRQLTKIFKEVASNSEVIPEYVKSILRALKSANLGKPSVVFKIVQDCLQMSKKDNTFSSLVFREHVRFIDILDASKIISKPVDFDLFRADGETGKRNDSDCISFASDEASVDPSLVTNDVIDRDNFFCNPCGIRFIPGDIAPNDSSQELWTTHIAEATHAESCAPFNLFMAQLNKDSLIKAAEAKVQELEDIRHSSKSDRLDYVLDCLQAEVSHYFLEVAETKLNRTWRKGLLQLSQTQETIDHLLKKADDLVFEVRNSEKLKENIKESLPTENASSMDCHNQKVEPVKKAKKKKRKANKH